MICKELLTVEFRYRDDPKGSIYSEHKTKVITIGIYDTLEEAVNEGNKILKTLSITFEVRQEDKFSVKCPLLRSPQRLVTNTCYPTNGIQYFAKITRLSFDDLTETVNETFNAFRRYKEYKSQSNLD